MHHPERSALPGAACLSALMLAALACSPHATPTPTMTAPAVLATALAPSATLVPSPASPSATPTTAAPSPTASRTQPTQLPATAVPAATDTLAPVAAADWHYAQVNDVAWLPTGETLAIASSTGLQVHQVGTATALYTLAPGLPLASVAGRQSGDLLATATYSNTLQIWDLQARQLVRTLEGPNLPVPGPAYNPATAHLRSLAFSPDGTQLAAAVEGYYAGGEGSVWRWQVDSAAPLEVLGTYGPPRRLAFSPDGAYLAAATLGQTCGRGGGGITLWGSGTAQPQSLSDGGNNVLALAFAPGGQLIAGAGGSGERCIGPSLVHVWSLTGGGDEGTFSTAASATSVAYSADGALLAAGDQSGTLYLWDAASGQALCSWNGHGAAVAGLAFSPSGRSLASWSVDGTVRVWQGL